MPWKFVKHRVGGVVIFDVGREEGDDPLKDTGPGITEHRGDGAVLETGGVK